MPAISVIMGVLYRQRDLTLLERAVRSILAQTESNFEFLICDDGSCDSACELLNSLAGEDKRIRLIREGTLLSLPAKLNACLRVAAGEFIARMDDDDFSHPDRFEKQLAFLSRRSGPSFVGCNVALQCDGKVTGRRILPEYPGVSDFYFVQPYIHPALMFRREALERVGGYSEDRHCILCEDYDLLLRMYAAGYTGANLQEILFDYTVSATAKGKRKMVHRWNETVTRWRRFRELRQLPKALPWVVKPLVVGLLPEAVLARLKQMRS